MAFRKLLLPLVLLALFTAAEGARPRYVPRTRRALENRTCPDRHGAKTNLKTCALHSVSDNRAEWRGGCLTQMVAVGEEALVPVTSNVTPKLYAALYAPKGVVPYVKADSRM
ncbi:unnamed protein product [Closterium sp. Yama58-4]|nr:unnamed protein product [Closterium sp. Yama58-4]